MTDSVPNPDTPLWAQDHFDYSYGQLSIGAAATTFGGMAVSTVGICIYDSIVYGFDHTEWISWYTDVILISSAIGPCIAMLVATAKLLADLRYPDITFPSPAHKSAYVSFHELDPDDQTDALAAYRALEVLSPDDPRFNRVRTTWHDTLNVLQTRRRAILLATPISQHEDAMQHLQHLRESQAKLEELNQ